MTMPTELTLDRISDTFVVYMLLDPTDGAIKFVGTSVLANVYLLEDARRNSLFRPTFTALKAIISVDSEHAMEVDALRRAHTLISTIRPVCNVKGIPVHPSKQKIVCNQTAEVFSSPAEVCRAHGIAASNLSNHLNQKAGYRSIRGRTYRREV